jgi:hypothetical protein
MASYHLGRPSILPHFKSPKNAISKLPKKILFQPQKGLVSNIKKKSISDPIF